jgi:hypothetical protein
MMMRSFSAYWRLLVVDSCTCCLRVFVARALSPHATPITLQIGGVLSAVALLYPDDYAGMLREAS